MKLYRVEVTKVIYVVSENEIKAESDAQNYIRDDYSDVTASATLATHETIERDGWRGALAFWAHKEDYPIREAIKLNV